MFNLLVSCVRCFMKNENYVLSNEELEMVVGRKKLKKLDKLSNNEFMGICFLAAVIIVSGLCSLIPFC